MTTTGTKPRPAPPVDGPPAPPHPRIRARRIEIRRDEGRRRRQRLMGLLAFLVLVCACGALTRSAALDIDHIVVVGARHTPAAALAGAAGLRRGAAMTDVDGAAAARRMRTLPWVQTATVQRHWPGTVRIHVTERRAVARVRSGPGWAAVAGDGRVLRATAGPAPLASLVPITGLAAGAPGSTMAGSARAPLRLAAALPPALATKVASIAPQAGGELRLTLVEGGITVRIGPPTELPAKVLALSALLASADRTPPIATIDVTVPGASVLTRQPGHA